MEYDYDVDSYWKIKLIDGDFFVGDYVTIEKDGKRYRRKVTIDREAGDICITINGYKYYYGDII